VAHLERKQLFLVKMQDGSVYRGTVNSLETPASHSMDLQVTETPEKKVTLDSARIAGIAETSEKFLPRLTGA
jgi:hypothetical protein